MYVYMEGERGRYMDMDMDMDMDMEEEGGRGPRRGKRHMQYS